MILPLLFAAAWAYGSGISLEKTRASYAIPTTRIGRVKKGRVELMGQVLPDKKTLAVNVDGRFHVSGLVGWKWSRSRREGSGERERIVVEETAQARTSFILHDGTGGVAVDLESFEPVYGSSFESLDEGGRIWNVAGLGIGDPVYLIGHASRSRKRARLQKQKELFRSARYVIRGASDGDAESVLERGTELRKLGQHRSGFESGILPLIITAAMAVGTIIGLFI